MWKHRCVLPFHHMAIRPDGGIRPCCYFREETVPNDLNTAHADPFNHLFLTDIRERMLKDEYIEGCSKCYADEAASGKSMRLDMNNPFTEFGLPKQNRGETPKLTNLDFAFSNVCNNKCRMCGPELSTQWYSDAKKMQYGFEQRGVIARNSIIEDYDLSDLRFIKMLGGEPLMEQDKFIKMLKKCNLSELTILLVTNTTQRPNEELTELFKQCKKMTITFSIDSHGAMNDFLRKGSNWQQVEENVAWFKKTFAGYPIDLSVHSVASIYNINLIEDLIIWCLKNRLYHNYVVVDGPNWIMPRHIPESVKAELIPQLEARAKSHGKYGKIFKLLINELEQPGDFGMFIRNDIRLNGIRNESWETLNPWLWKRIQKFIVPEIL
jgi:MoaA/NifB/PqqE/SkfB family radical SAM enzyme